MTIYKHRCNSVELLNETPPVYGIEMDLRTHKDEIIVAHDPFSPGPRLSDWLCDYRHAGLILNVKEEGLEDRILEIVFKFGIANYLFLDQSYPFMVKWLTKGLQAHIAARVSEYESINSVKSLVCMPSFIWCDSFTGSWEHLPEVIEVAQDRKLQVIIVSPELHSRSEQSEIKELQQMLTEFNSEGVNVCTKNPENWLNCITPGI